MKLFNNLSTALIKYSAKNAFCINGQLYKYSDLSSSISKIRKAVRDTTDPNEKNIGLIGNDDLETYAAIIALWFEAKTYVPVSPDAPKDRSEDIFGQAEIKTVIDSSASPLFPNFKAIASRKLSATEIDITPKNISDSELAYILFTSGTTGRPKGVPITRANLTGFMDAFFKLDISLTEADRCLQMFELTFDLSVVSYLAPLLKGACIYTIPKDKIKYSYISELMDEHKLTFSLMVPAMLHYLRPYFDEINSPELKYSMFCGEALPEDVTKEWATCVPNAKIINVYGPTEDTIYCTVYYYNRNEKNKTHNGVLCIGKAMEGTQTVIIDENNKLIPFGNMGQLCLAGVQLTPGYWKNEEKNKEAFFYLGYEGNKTRFYKTGDLCYVDKEGDILYNSRADNQIKVQGFRIELSEIEFHAKVFLDKVNVVTVAGTDELGNTEIGMIIESKSFDHVPLMNYMKSKMPAYMIPRKVTFTDAFPLNMNGKTDRNKLKKLLYS